MSSNYLKPTIYVRWALTALLIFAIYFETGPWTVVALVLFTMRTEFDDYRIWQISNRDYREQ